MNLASLQAPTGAAQLAALGEAHQRVLSRFFAALHGWQGRGALSAGQVALISTQLLSLAERFDNPSNTGNLEDLFNFTLEDTGDPIRAYAQVLADAMKVVPLPEHTPLWPALRRVSDGSRVSRIGELRGMPVGDRMLVAHTMAAFGDPELRASAEALVRLSHPGLSEAEVQQAVARMAVQSQHLPSSTFVLARAAGLTVECAAMYEAAGYSPAQAEAAQRFYDVCARFDPAWAEDFVAGRIPQSPSWRAWRARYLSLRADLVPELVYQLSSDTLTNFGEGTMESGKWTEACVFFGRVPSPEHIPEALCRTVNQYIAENIALHDLPADTLIEACRAHLEPWGISFKGGLAYVFSARPARARTMLRQFEAATLRRRRLEASRA